HMSLSTFINSRVYQKLPSFPTRRSSDLKEIPVLKETKRWLDLYFSGKEPDFTVPIHLIGTDFQKEVWRLLCQIPYGKTMTYGERSEEHTSELQSRFDLVCSILLVIKKL